MPTSLKQRSVLLLLFVLGLALGLRVWFVFAQGDTQPFAQYVGRANVVRGVVTDDPDVRANGVRVPLRVSTINGTAAQGTVLAVVPRDTPVAYGDTLEVRGVLEEPQNFETETGRVFDYEGYLAVRGVRAVMQRAVVRAQEPGGMSVRGSLYALKHYFERGLERVVQEPAAALLEGILLGERGGFNQTLLQAFIIVGLIHIVVLSGSNISIVAEGVFRLFGALPVPRTVVYLLGGSTIVLFCLMTGGGAAGVRAVIMAGIAILARYLHRSQDALRALVAAAVLMVAWNPLILLHDNGFILSVLATFGMITLAPAIEAKLKWFPSWRHFNLRSIAATTLGVELFILPALLYTSGVLSFVALPMNALVLPLVPPVMLLGFVAGVLALVHPVLAYLPAFGATLLLQLMLWLTTTVAALPFAATIVAPFPWWVAALAYVPLTFGAIRIYVRPLAS